MTHRLESSSGQTLAAMLGPTGVGDDAGIMAAQLQRASLILQRPSVPSGALFETEPATFYARLEANAPETAA